MNWKKALVGFALIDFTAFLGYVIYQYGLVGFGKLAFANAATTQVAIDLVVALLFVTGWMIRDAKERGTNATPFIVLTLTLGSVGPMLYYLMRKEAPKASTETTPMHMQAATAR